MGRVPLILHCKHNLCEECIRHQLRTSELCCAECKETFEVEPETRLQEEFPVNFYLLGLLYYARPNMAADDVRIHFRPADVSFVGKLGFRSTGMTNRNDLESGFVASGFHIAAADAVKGEQCFDAACA